MQRPVATRVLGWSMAALLAAPALVLLAWLASNWRDAPALPRPAALASPAPRVADPRNAYQALADLRAAKPGSTQQLADPHGAPWNCGGDRATCAAAWLQQPEALARQREAIAWGPRCDALVDADFEFEEKLPQPITMSWMPDHLRGVSACMRWFLSGAVLARARDDSAAVQRELTRADRFNRAVMAGSHSLIANMLAMRAAQMLLDTVGALAVQQDRDGAVALLTPVLANWPPQADAMRRWMAFESAFNQHAIRMMFDSCATLGDLPATPGVQFDPDRAFADRVEDAATAWLCRHRIGFQPERTAQYIDAMWLRRLAVLSEGGLPALERFDRAIEARGTAGWQWQNTLGASIIDLGEGGHLSYTRRHLDVELQHRLVTLVLAMQREGIEAPARAAWLARHKLADSDRERISMRDSGYTIAARSFSGTQAVAGERGEFVVAWPR